MSRRMDFMQPCQRAARAGVDIAKLDFVFKALYAFPVCPPREDSGVAMSAIKGQSVLSPVQR